MLVSDFCAEVAAGRRAFTVIGRARAKGRVLILALPLTAAWQVALPP